MWQLSFQWGPTTTDPAYGEGQTPPTLPTKGQAETIRSRSPLRTSPAITGGCLPAQRLAFLPPDASARGKPHRRSPSLYSFFVRRGQGEQCFFGPYGDVRSAGLLSYKGIAGAARGAGWRARSFQAVGKRGAEGGREGKIPPSAIGRYTLVTAHIYWQGGFSRHSRC